MNKNRVYSKRADAYGYDTKTMPLLSLLIWIANNYIVSMAADLEIHQVIPPKIKGDKSTVKVMGIEIQKDGTLKTI